MSTADKERQMERTRRRKIENIGNWLMGIGLSILFLLVVKGFLE